MMTKLELLKMIGDVLTEIDTTIGNLLPSDPNQRDLQDQRILLDDRQRQLAGQIFEENSAEFQNAAQQVQQANTGIAASLQNLQNLQNGIANVTRFLNAVTSLLTTAAAFV
jgi:hypothetical protein